MHSLSQRQDDGEILFAEVDSSRLRMELFGRIVAFEAGLDEVLSLFDRTQSHLPVEQTMEAVQKLAAEFNPAWEGCESLVVQGQRLEQIRGDIRESLTILSNWAWVNLEIFQAIGDSKGDRLKPPQFFYDHLLAVKRYLGQLQIYSLAVSASQKAPEAA